MSIGKDGVKLNPQGVGKGRLPLAFGYLSMPDDEFAAVVQENIPGSTVRQTELGNFIVDTEDGEYTLNRPGISMRDVQSLAFKAGAATPAGFTRFAGPKAVGVVAGQEVLTEAGVQGLEAAAGGEFTPEDVAVAGVGGFTGQSVGEVASMAGRGAAGQMPEYAQRVIEAGKEGDVGVLTSDLADVTLTSKLAARTGEMVPLIGTGRTRLKQKKDRETLAKSLQDKYLLPSSQAISDSLASSASRKKQAAGRAKGNIVEELKDEWTGKNTLEAITATIQNLKFSKKGIPRSEKNIDKALIDKLEGYAEDIIADPSFANIDELRTNFRKDLKGDATKIVTDREQASINKVYSAMTNDLDDVVKNNLSDSRFEKWKRAARIYAQESEALGKGKIKNALEAGELAPDKVERLLRDKGREQLSRLYNSLGVSGKKHVRASLIHDAAEKAKNSDGTISPDGFVKNLRRDQKTIDEFFKGDEKKALDGFMALIEATERAGNFDLATATGQQAIGIGTLMSGYLVNPKVLAALAASGGLARLYESPLARDFLIKLGNTKPRTTEFDNLLRESTAVTNALAATLAKEIDQE